MVNKKELININNLPNPILRKIKKRKKNFVWDVLIYILLIFLVLICIIPFYSMIISSSHDNATLAASFQLLPGKYFIKNYTRMTLMVNIWKGFLNSIIIATTSTVLNAYFCALTGFGFSKYKFKYRKQLFWIVLITMMLPGQLGIIGYFQLMNNIKLLNTFPAIVIPSMISTMTVFWNKQYMDSYVPDSLIECARIDGCGELKIFHRIVFPIIIPAVATMAIFTFVGAWNNFISPLILLFSQEKFPLPVLVQQMQGMYKQDYGVVYLGVTMSVIPIMVLFSLCSRKVINGLTAGAIKG